MRHSFFLVDDHPVTNCYNKSLLEKIFPNAEIITFEEGQEFKNYIFKNHAKYALPESILFLDLNLESTSAFEILDELDSMNFEISQHLKIYLLTNDLSVRTYEKIKVYPEIKGLLEKPLTLDKLDMILCEKLG